MDGFTSALNNTDIWSLIADMNKQIASQVTEIMAESRKDIDDLSDKIRNLTELMATQNESSHYKMEFPRFDGKNARGWVNKAGNFFILKPPIDSHTKVIYASLYLDGEADCWYQTIQAENQGLAWENFKDLVLQRFSTGNEENRFNKLVQTGSVDSYVGQFEELRGFMMAKYPYHSDDFYLSSFISGLQPDIQQALYIYKPTSLQEAVDKAKEHEIFVEMIERNMRRGSSKGGVETKRSTPTIKRISPSEMAKRLEKGLCYNCDETYSPGHICISPQLFLLVSKPEENEAVGGSIQAVHTIRIKGLIKRRTVQMLIVAGTTHNFLSQSLVNSLGLKTSHCPPFKVQLADGSVSHCYNKIEGLKWKMASTIFKSDFYSIPLGGYDAILGEQWLKQVSPVCFDFDRQEVTIKAARTHCDHLASLSSDLNHIPTPNTPCHRCQHPSENWLCLCCKEVLCSRFVNKHMLEHSQQSNHCLALSYSDLSVWCFSCDAYLDAQVILSLRPVYETAYILKFGEAPPVRAAD